MPEVFRKGVHIIPIKISQGNRGECGKITLKSPVTLDACVSSANAWAVGDTFVVKPRGSPNVWKLYRVQGGRGCIQLYEHSELEPVLAYARLLYG